MPLHIEQICDDLKDFLAANLKAQLDTTLSEYSNTIPVSVPRPENYFIGERNQFVPYAAPSCFIMPSHTNEVTGPYEGGNILKFEHFLFLSFLLEGTDAQNLNRATYRMLQAVTQCIRDMDIVPAGATQRTTVVHIPKIDYGQSFVAQAQRMFRRESWMTLRIEHWDTRTTLPVQIT